MSDTITLPKELWVDICSVLELTRRHDEPDPLYHDRVKQLGREIGFGALMSTASAGWRESTEFKGSEFISGPCRATMDALLQRIDEFNIKEADQLAKQAMSDSNNLGTKLQDLLAAAKDHVTTPEEVLEQRINFVHGQMMDCAPGLTKDDIRKISDAVYGKPTGE